ncbi:MAG: hypothetical protein M1324_02265 [Patescibacteria group bacterium]|nr:hypothetical protein [Patescibacteria group bacterium]
MDKNIAKIIEGLGFEGKEAVVYLACLELDYASNSQIAEKTKLNRITNYEILKRLEKRGVITVYLKKEKKYFMAVDPRLIVRQVKEKIKIAENALPEILSIVNQIKKKPKIQYYEGTEGIKNIYLDSLDCSQKEILTFTNPKDIYNFLGREFSDEYVNERTKRNIRVKGLAPNDQYGEEAKKEGHKLLRETRLFDKEAYDIKNEIMIYDDKIAIFSDIDEIGLIIENEKLAQTFKSIWHMAWDKMNF